MILNRFLQEKKMQIYAGVTLVGTDGVKISIGELLEEYREYKRVKKVVDLEFIFESALRFFDISRTVMLSKWKNSQIVKKKMMIMFFMLERNFKCRDVGDFFKMNHTSAGYAKKVITKKIAENVLDKSMYQEMRNFINLDIEL